ncbi:murein biosynthesis integral membrane protein MurJ [Fundicoccus culcitae]|uniref:Probable lipid II flippase MurJ n=1 Tax=Fundicoccus culcitae TaxID=2969821 RepID=A0ABY5P941_9LACT|nr:murein biosynthesis integral membrane protein MurJ [Fundicoccus culcitae]UUX35262.1 murein biosynthesis integral membrane protein MurJ [Fundicoccus culcitae]
MRKTAIIIMLITLFSKGFGFARDITLSYFYGASSVSDAYLISQTLPEVVFGFIVAGISTGYIPIYSSIHNQAGKKSALKFTNNLINVLFVLCLIFFAVAFVFAPQLVTLFASGFDDATFDLAVNLTRIGLTGIYFTAVLSVFTGYLQMNGDYITPSATGFPLNIITILAIIVSAYVNNPLILAVGTVLATASQVVMLLPSAIKRGYRYEWRMDWRDSFLIQMFKTSIPVMFGVSVNQINVLVDRTLASTIVEGGISVLNYSHMITFFIKGVFVVSIVSVMYPTVARLAAEGQMEGVKRALKEVVTAISLIVIPATVGLIVFAEPIVNLLFVRGEFTVSDGLLTANVLIFYSLGMIGDGLREVVSRVFYSLNDTRTPTINAVIGVVINVILNILLSRYMGVSGLAFATSISAIVTTLLLFYHLRKKMGPLQIHAILRSLAKILIASILMGVAAVVAYRYLINHLNPTLVLFIAIAIGIIVYTVGIYWLKIDDVENLRLLVKQQVSKFRNKAE